MKTVIVVIFSGNHMEVYSTISTFLSANRHIKLKGQTIRNKMSDNKGVYDCDGFKLERFIVKR